MNPSVCHEYALREVTHAVAQHTMHSVCSLQNLAWSGPTRVRDKGPHHSIIATRQPLSQCNRAGLTLSQPGLPQGFTIQAAGGRLGGAVKRNNSVACSHHDGPQCHRLQAAGCSAPMASMLISAADMAARSCQPGISDAGAPQSRWGLHCQR